MICPVRGQQLPGGPGAGHPRLGLRAGHTEPSTSLTITPLGMQVAVGSPVPRASLAWAPVDIRPAAWERGDGGGAGCCLPSDLPRTGRCQRKTHPPSHRSCGLDEETPVSRWAGQGCQLVRVPGQGPAPWGCSGQQVGTRRLMIATSEGSGLRL